jgi:predicted RND superfamily exporter protein
MNQLGKLVVSFPKTTIALTVAATAILTAAIAWCGIGFDGSPQTLTRNDDALHFYNEVRASFGDDRVIVVALTTGDAFTPEFIHRLERLTARLETVPGVEEVMSLSNIKAARTGEGGIVIDRLVPRNAPADQLKAIKATATRDPLYARHYVSEDGRTAAINVFIKPLLSEPQSRAVAEEIELVARAEANGDDLLLAGVPILDARAIRNMVRDMLVISPIAALLCFVAFLFAFRSFWGAVLPMAALVIGLVWTLGIMSLAGRPVTFATLPLPTTLLAVGGSYIFHVLNQYHVSLSHAGINTDAATARSAWLAGLQFIGPAVIVSGTATMAGFGSLASSTIPTVRDMGVFEALGVGFMLLLSISFVPAALCLLPPRALCKASSDRKEYATWLNGALRHITAWILFRRRTVLAIFLVLTLLIGVGALWLHANTDYLRIFPSHSETVQAAEKLHERLSGAAAVQLVVSGKPGAASQPDFLLAVSRLEEFALSQKGVDAAISAADIVKRLNSLLDAKRAEEIPKDASRLQHIFDDFLSQDESISRLVNSDRSAAVIVLNTNLYSSNELRDLTTKIVQWSAANLPAGSSARPTGSTVLLNDASDAIAASQTDSLAIALVSIYLMMVILFRSFATALLALIPNLLPIICFFGFLGWTGIYLDITTSLVASAALGLAVDNAVHTIRRYRQCLYNRGGANEENEGWAMWLTLLRTGKPMVLANVMLTAAFLIFVLSSFVPVRTAGLLWAVTIMACLASDLIFLPALMKSWPFARVTPGRIQIVSSPVMKQTIPGPQEGE